jgi:hypothetical protein
VWYWWNVPAVVSVDCGGERHTEIPGPLLQGRRRFDEDGAFDLLDARAQQDLAQPLWHRPVRRRGVAVEEDDVHS